MAPVSRRAITVRGQLGPSTPHASGRGVAVVFRRRRDDGRARILPTAAPKEHATVRYPRT